MVSEQGTTGGQVRERVPLRERPWDLVLIAFFAVNVCFITYVVDIEQLTVPSVAHFRYPLWPPHAMVDLVHWWGRHYDPLLMARPPFWKMLIWIDALFFGPFYAVAIYAFVRGRDWIRIPAVFWAGMMACDVLVILAEERYGIHRTPQFPMVLAANVPWLLLPFAVVARMWRSPTPFTRPATTTDLVAPSDAGGGVVPVVG